MKRSTSAAVLVVALVGLVGVACVPPPPPQSGYQYVALGDWDTAGPLIPTQSDDPAGCQRSDHNYPHLAAAIGTPRFRDVRCSGAATEDMTQPQDVSPGPNPPEFDALDAETTMVSVGIGGNDIGFTDIAESCVALFRSVRRARISTSSTGSTRSVPASTRPLPKVAAVLQGIHQRAPAATIYVVNYLPIFPEGPLSPGAPEGCWPQLPYAYNDVPYLREKQKELNGMLATQAAANGAVLVDEYTAGIGHDACRSSSQRWVEPIVPTSPAAPLHPNAAGMQGTANVLFAAIGAG